MSATTAHRPQHVSFQSPAASSSSLRQSTLKKNMSITQTYYLAHKARGKLSREAAQPDHDLRLLVGHANLLDSLMLELADAEREQERWFNQSVRGAHTPKKLPQERHVSFAPEDVISEEDDEEAVYDSDSSEDDYNEDDDVVMTTVPSLRPEQSFKAPAQIQTREVAAEEDAEMHDDDLEEDYAQLELVRTPSHSNSPMPELVDESDSSDDESSMPPSPPNAALPMPSGKDVAAKQEQESLYGDEYHMPQGIPAAISVY